MSPSKFPLEPTPPVPVVTYEERTGALLAQVADLLLRDKHDWATLERLEAALAAPPPGPTYLTKFPATDRTSYGDGSKPLTEYGTYTMGGGVAHSSDVMASLSYAYERKLAEMLAEDKTARFKSLYSGEPSDHSHASINPALYDYSYKKSVTDPEPITAEKLKEYLKKMYPDTDK